MTSYGFQLHKEEHQLPQVGAVTLGSSAWLQLQKNDEIMRINNTPVWNLDIEEINSLISDADGKLDITLRR